jgi:transcriptional regulator with XRE-family HTH domain
MAEDLKSLIGRRAKSLRLQHGRSLREQAGRAGLSASALSKLENGGGGLSLESLQQLTADFEVHITDLFAEDDVPVDEGAEPLELFPNCIADTPQVVRGHGTVFQQIGQSRGHQLQPYLITVEPGGGWRAIWDVKAGEEFLYVLAGEIELLVDDEPHRLRQGDAARFRTERSHGIRNPSEHGPATVVGASTPPW